MSDRRSTPSLGSPPSSSSASPPRGNSASRPPANVLHQQPPQNGFNINNNSFGVTSASVPTGDAYQHHPHHPQLQRLRLVHQQQRLLQHYFQQLRMHQLQQHQVAQQTQLHCPYQRSLHHRGIIGGSVAGITASSSVCQLLPKNKRKTNQNIFTKLLNRERGGGSGTGPLHPFHSQRQFFTNVVPNTTVEGIKQEVEVHVVKFSPDGKHLITVNRNYNELVVCRFEGFSASVRGDKELDLDNRFEKYFTPLYTSVITSAPNIIWVSFCLFWKEFIILASRTAQANENPTPSTQQDSIAHSSSYTPLNTEGTFDVTFSLIGLADGKIHSQRKFESDFIYLNYNGGVDLHNNIFAVLSIRNQQIHLFQLKRRVIDDRHTGKTTPTITAEFVDLCVIGQYCFEDDHLLLQQYENMNRTSQPPRAADASSSTNISGSSSASNDNENQQQRAPMITGIRHRLMAFLYRRCIQSKNSQSKLRNFYQNFEYYASLVMLKISFLDKHHLLIKFGKKEPKVTMAQVEDANSLGDCFLCVYNVNTAQIVSCYTYYSKQFISLYEKFTSHFHPPAFYDYDTEAGLDGTDGDIDYVCKYRTNSSNNIFCQEAFQKQKAEFFSAPSQTKSKTQIVQNALRYLPFSPQSFNPSQYFDHSLFFYNEQDISAFERPVFISDHPVKFHNRKNGAVRFRIPVGRNLSNSMLNQQQATAKVPVTYTFHPTLPFIITVKYCFNESPVVNIHFKR